jgi:hypothetical protein
LLLLDGQTFTHAVMGIIFGAAAFGCGLASARKDFSNVAGRWEGRIMAGLGLALIIVCVVYIPMAYHTQAKFNERSKDQKNRQPKSANERSGVDAGRPSSLHIMRSWPGATHRGR